MKFLTKNPVKEKLIDKIGLSIEKATSIDKYARAAFCEGFPITDIIDGAIETGLVSAPEDLFFIGLVFGHIKGSIEERNNALNRSMQ